jgi:apolipoprotein N-acyltransferase
VQNNKLYFLAGLILTLALLFWAGEESAIIIVIGFLLAVGVIVWKLYTLCAFLLSRKARQQDRNR